MQRILALDLGRVRIGISMSDSLRIIASPYENYQRKNISEDIAHINNIIKNNDVGLVVIGLPVSTDGSLNKQCESVMGFTEVLKKVIDVPVEFVDERYSTFSAEQLLIDANVRRENRKQLKDKLASAIFLQSYLDKIKNNKEF